MRLLVLSAAYPSPAEPQRAIFVENLNRALVDVSNGALHITVVAPRIHASDPLVEERYGLTVYRFPYPSGGRRLKEIANPSSLRLGAYLASGLWRSLSVSFRTRSDLLLAHWVLPAGVIGAAVARMLHIPLVLYSHGTDINRYARWLSGKLLAGWSLSQARRVFTVSRELAGILHTEHDVREEMVDLLPMGVAPEFFPGQPGGERAKLGLGDFFELLYVGDVCVEKGLEDLLAALEILWRNGVNVRLHVAGDGPLAAGLASRLEGRPVRLLGRLSPGDVARWYRGADLYVHPSHSEGAPVSVMEALSSGLPIVSTDVGGIPDLVAQEVTGLLVCPRDPPRLAAAIGRLYEDRELHESMRCHLRENLPDHSVEGRARALFPCLEEAAGASE